MEVCESESLEDQVIAAVQLSKLTDELFLDSSRKQNPEKNCKLADFCQVDVV